MDFESRKKAEEFVIKRLMESGVVNDAREEYDIDGILEACQRTVERDGVKVVVWNVPSNYDKFYDLVQIYAYPDADESGEGEFTAVYIVVNEWGENGDPLVESATEFTGTLREILADVMSKKNLRRDDDYCKLYTDVTDEHGNPVQGYRWFVDSFGKNEPSRITDPDEAQFIAYRGDQRIMLHHCPMPVYPLVVQRFLDRVYLKFHKDDRIIQYVELERV